jgi:hypothetical protein
MGFVHGCFPMTTDGMSLDGAVERYLSCSSYRQGCGWYSLTFALAFAPPNGTTCHSLGLSENFLSWSISDRLEPELVLYVDPMEELSHRLFLSLGRWCLDGGVRCNTIVETQKKRQRRLEKRSLKFNTRILTR